MLESAAVASRPKRACRALVGAVMLLSVGCGRGQVAAATPVGDGPAWGPGTVGQDGSFPMIPPGRLAAMRAAAAEGAPAWKALKANVDAGLEHTDLGDTSVMNVAVAYLVTGDRRYCERLAGEARGTIASANPRGDSYYGYAGIMADLATTLSYCGAVIDAPLRGEIAAYLDKWTDELWFHNQGSGWGLKDPGNNYHISFLLGTAWAGLALQAVGHPSARKYLDMVAKGIDAELAYLAERCAGGGWVEGTNYGEGSKGRLADLLSLVAAAGMKNVFQASDYFPAALRYAHYQLQPGNEYLYPAGDMARESNMTANPYTRGYVQQIVFWLADSDVRAVGQWYLEHVVPNYRTGFNHPHGLWRDVVYKLDIPSKPQSTLPLAYWAKGDNFVSMRSGWDAHATALMASGASNVDQSHAHLDTGGFTLWRDGWQVVDAVTYSHSGLLQEPGAHNLIHVDGARKVPVAPKGLVRFVDDARASYLQIDATGLYARGDAGHAKNMLLREMTRELVYLKPDTVIVYDRVEPAASGTAFDWRLHFPAQPTASGATIRATHGGGGVTVALLAGDAPTIVPDTDLAPDGSKTFRAQATSRTGRFLAALRVASGGAPNIDATAVTTTGDMEGVAVGDDVVLFSKLPFGKAPAPGFTYTVPAVAKRVHTLVNMSGSVGVAIKREGGNTVVTIAKGTDQTASHDGVIRFSE